MEEKNVMQADSAPKEVTPKQETTAAKPKSKKTPIILGIAAVVIIALLVTIIILLLKKDDKPEVDSLGDRATLVTEDNKDEVQKEIGNVPDDHYKTTMTIDWTFEDGSAASTDAYVENSVDNTRTVYFDVALADTNEVVYSSPYIPLGGKLDDITLSKDLDKGVYPAVITYYLVDDDHKVITDVSVAITLHINN